MTAQNKTVRAEDRWDLADLNSIRSPHNPQNIFTVIDTTGWEKITTEPAGAEVKHVLADPSDSAKRWFFKNNTVDERMRYGEDFAELIACHLAPLFGVASAEVHLATHDDVEGVISLDVSARGLDLIHGAVWLPTHGIDDFKYGDKFRKGHSLINIKKSLTDVHPPPSVLYPDSLTGFDAFAGMCLFDAWIANQDRHEENWAVLRPMVQHPDLKVRLSPAYDNASSLGFNLSEDRLKFMLEDSEHNRVESWCARSKANRLERVGSNQQRLGLVAAAEQALSLCTDAGRNHWTNRLNTVDEVLARAIAHQIPKMSQARRTFINKLLTVNLGRIRDVCTESS